jgi:hypothetical protein
MQDQFGALERVVGSVKSGINRVQSFFSKNWEEVKDPDNRFNEIRRIQDLNDRFASEIQRLNPNDVRGKNVITSYYLSRFITILKNYISFFEVARQDLERYKKAVVKTYEDKNGAIPRRFLTPDQSGSRVLSDEQVFQQVLRKIDKKDLSGLIALAEEGVFEKYFCVCLYGNKTRLIFACHLTAKNTRP